MKYRTGFVSNSSSSSFICKAKDLTDEQILKLLNYQNSEDNTDGWSVYHNAVTGEVHGFTSMDNCAISEWGRQEMEIYSKLTFEDY